ncbi:putative quinol monooxygenase [Chloroflexota bacterium]
MSVLVLNEAQVKPENISDMKSYMKEILPDTREYSGCQNVEVYFNIDDANNMVLVEHWNSREHYEKYLAWRAEIGSVDIIVAMLAGLPTIRYFEKIDV